MSKDRRFKRNATALLAFILLCRAHHFTPSVRAQDTPKSDPGVLPPPVSPAEPPREKLDKPLDILGEPPALLATPKGPRQAGGGDVLNGGEEQPPRDSELRKVEASTEEENPLPPAVQDPKGNPAPEKSAAAVSASPLVMTPDKFPVGRQTVALSVEVLAPKVMSLKQEGILKLVIRNTSATDATLVRVHYELHPALELINDQPVAQKIGGNLLTWVLSSVAAGSEQVITLKVKANQVADIDHAAQITMVAGSRARTAIQEPKLKVEQTVSPGRLLIGQQAQFRIRIENNGTGPARNVLVQAKLSSGLRHGKDDFVQLEPIDVIPPNGHVDLPALVVDTLAGGEQSCHVSVTSSNVDDSDDMKVKSTLTVTQPELKLAIAGPAKRFTDTLADYQLIVENPGTAPAQNVSVSAVFPPSGATVYQNQEARLDRAARRMTWTIPSLQPSEKQKFSFQVKLTRVGPYEVVGIAKSGGLSDTKSISTEVDGMADLELDITERRRVLDIGEKTVFDLKITNHGTKEATNLQVTSLFSKNLEVARTAGLEDSPDPTFKRAEANDTFGELVFPLIRRLAPGSALELSIEAEAVAAGPAVCRVKVLHDDLSKDFPLEDVTHARVTGETRVK